MKSTGMVRNIDALGRMVLPIEVRKVMDMQNGDALEYYTNGDSIVLRKYMPGCVFCGEVTKVVEHHDKKVCKKCLKELKPGKPDHQRE